MERIEIKLSKTKLLFGIGGSMLFILLGLYSFNGAFGRAKEFNPLYLKAAGLVTILFFGCTLMYGIIKLLDSKPGLIIDRNGITDNSHGSSIGFIKWSDITAFKVQQVMSTRFLLIFTNDPNAVIEKAAGLKRKMLQANFKLYGTPLAITSTTLQYDIKALHTLLTQRLDLSRSALQ